MSGAAHAAAVRAMLEPVVRLYEGEAPDDAVLPYAVLYMSSGTTARTTLASQSDRHDAPFQITSVGLDGAGARSVADRVHAAVADRRPVIDGRRSSLVTQELAEPLRVDRDVVPHRLYLVDGYTFFTVPSVATEPFDHYAGY